MNFLERLHQEHIRPRRARRLSELLASFIPAHSRVLDVGSGDGFLSHSIMQKNPQVDIVGIDILRMQNTFIPTALFDGKEIPFADAAFDIVMFVDVLHHSDNASVLLTEADRVAGKTILIKDHTCDGLLAHPTLRFMDYVGNFRHGVPLPYNYLSKHEWFVAFEHLGLKPHVWKQELGLYPWFINWLFGRSLHFIAALNKID